MPTKGNLVWLQRMHERSCFPEISEEQEGTVFSLNCETFLKEASSGLSPYVTLYSLAHLSHPGYFCCTDMVFEHIWLQ